MKIIIVKNSVLKFNFFENGETLLVNLHLSLDGSEYFVMENADIGKNAKMLGDDANHELLKSLFVPENISFDTDKQILFWSIKAENNIVITLAEIYMRKSHELDFASWNFEISQYVNDLSEKIKSQNISYQALKSESEKLISELQISSLENTERENILLNKFRLILNEKKKKIKKLLDFIKNAKVNKQSIEDETTATETKNISITPKDEPIITAKIPRRRK